MNYEVLEWQRIQEAVAKHCSFSGGKALVMEEQPSFQRLVVAQRLQRMKEALACTISYGPMPFYGVREIRPLIAMSVKGGVLNGMELMQIAAHESCVSGCQAYLKQVETKPEALLDLSESLVHHVAVTQKIERCIAPTYEVMDNASAQLASVRKAIRAQMSKIDSTVQQYIHAHRNELMEPIAASRNERTVVLVKQAYKNQLEGIQYGESASKAAVYIEPSCAVALNNRLQELKQKEQQEVERVLRALSEAVAKEADSYVANMETIACLDAIFAKAAYGKEMDGCVAELSADDSLVLKQARHPLIAKDKVVANTYRIHSPYTTLLITGPNTGGKTVSLKTIGLLILMTYAGMPIPCREARMPMYDQLFVDIGDQQSIEQSLSTFSGHIAALAAIFRNATTKSLVILDELCSGTDPKEGENLAIAILDAFRVKHIFVIATTHYSKLKAYGRQHDDILLASVAFDMEKLQPTYRYEEGLTGQSNAFDIALRYGFDPALIAHARKLKEEDATEQEKLLEALEQQMAQYRQLVDEARQQKEESEAIRKQWMEKQRLLLEHEEQRMREAKEQADQYVQMVREEADAIIDELKQKETYRMHEAADTIHALNALEQQQIEAEHEEAPEELAVGDTVRIIQTRQIAEVLSVHAKHAMVLASGTRMKVSLDNLRKEANAKVEKKKESITVKHGSAFRLECNLIGMRVEEARQVLSKYLDDALLANVSFVRIIHGNGTGALRKGVWDYLKKCPYVKGYRLGNMGEGGSGATVVILKES